MSADPARPLAAVRIWAEMIKFSHSVFALPFALAATFLAGRHLAGGLPRPGQLLLIVVCMVAARSVAMTFNRIVDLRIDALNPRTASRPLPAGKLTVIQAWLFLVVFFLTFAAGCVTFWWWYANPWPMWLGGPMLMFGCAYSLTKRFTQWSHLWLGAAIGLSPAAAWIAVDPASLGWPAVLLSGAVTLWIGGFDVIYACQDVEFDRHHRLHSLPARLGLRRALQLARVMHVGVVLLLVGVGVSVGLAWLYYAGVAAVAMLLVIENAAVHPDDLSKVNLAFFTINGVVSLVYGGCVILDVVLMRGQP